MNQPSLIYRLLALHLLLAHAQGLLERLELPTAEISHPRQLTNWGAGSPRGARGFAASLRTTNLNFGISPDVGINITRLNARGVEDWPDPYGRHPVEASSVSTNLAYQLARGWLEQAGVDVDGLEAKYPVEIEHRGTAFGGPNLVGPNFHVKWGDGQYQSHPDSRIRTEAARVALDAHAKRWVRVRIADTAFYKHPLPQITNAWGITELPDEPVKRLLQQPGMDYTNAFALLETLPAYREARFRLLLAEAKKVVSLLGVHSLDELRENRLKEAYVFPPAFGLGGLLTVEQGEVLFGPDGKVRRVACWLGGATNVADLKARLKAGPFLSTNEALALALDKLAAASIDLEQLGRDHERHFHQRRDYEHVNGRVRYYDTCEYGVSWGETAWVWDSPLHLILHGFSKRIARLEVNDPAYWHRPPVLATNLGGAPQPGR